MIGAYTIMEMYCPGIFARSFNEIKGVSTGIWTMPGAIAHFFYSLGVIALGLPDQVMKGIAG
jgi:hypothetical protein